MMTKRSELPNGLDGPHESERGVALVTVIGLSLVMLILIATAASFSISGMVKARNDQDWNAALAAAYAGADDYASRISNDSTYQKYGNPNSPFSIGTGSAATVALPPSPLENPAFGVGESDAWAVIPGTSNRASFRYEVDNSNYDRFGTIRLRSTGRVGDETRSVVVNLKQKGFIDWLYFTDYEIMDPQISDSRCVPGYAFQSGSTVKHNSYCTEINFAAADTINGPAHSNDTMRICGAVFNGTLTTMTTRSPNFVKPSSCADGTYINGATGPITVDKVGMPLTNLEMAAETRVDVPTVTRPGCLYTGPTSITFTSNGKMNVVSPWTKVTQPSLTAGIPHGGGAGCGNIAALNSAAGATIDVLDRNLIYVQDVPSSGNPNYSASNPAGFSCTGSGATSGWSFGTTTYPLAGEALPPSSTSAVPAYQCKKGDVFVKGTLAGAMTIAASNFVYVTGDLTYADVSADMLGLVGQNAVWVWNPMSGSRCKADRGDDCTAMTSAGSGRVIHAAILSVAHTFQVQNHDAGGRRGKLTVLGAISQKFRGTVSNGSSTSSTGEALVTNGFKKDYNYDTRLRNTAPPKFLTPTSTTYGVTQYADVAAAFTADGTVVPLP